MRDRAGVTSAGVSVSVQAYPGSSEEHLQVRWTAVTSWIILHDTNKALARARGLRTENTFVTSAIIFSFKICILRPQLTTLQ